MAIAAGHPPTAAQLNALQVTAKQVSASGIVTVTTSEADVTGATTTVTVTGANAYIVAIGVFDVNGPIGTGAVFQGRLSVAGATQTGEAHSDDHTGRITCSQTWMVTVAPGTPTVKLRCLKSGGSFDLINLHTTLTVLIFDLP